MKEKLVLLLVLFAIINNAAFTQNNFKDRDFDIMGVYLPVEYIEALVRTKHNPAAWAAIDFGKYLHTVYIVNWYTIYTSGFYDGMGGRVSLRDIYDFQYENVDGDTFLIDAQNNRFKKIPGDLYDFEYEDWSAVVNNFVGSVILDELIKNGGVILENGVAAFPGLDNQKFRVQWQAYDPKVERNLDFNREAGCGDLTLKITHDEYVFYGYHTFSTNIVLSVCYEKTGIFPSKDDFYGGWVNGLDVKHIISENKWTFVSPNGNTYTVSDLVWEKATNYNATFVCDETGIPYSTYYRHGYTITGKVSSIAYNDSHYLYIGFKRTFRYFIHENDKTKIMLDNNPREAAFFSK